MFTGRGLQCVSPRLSFFSLVIFWEFVNKLQGKCELVTGEFFLYEDLLCDIKITEHPDHLADDRCVINFYTSCATNSPASPLILVNSDEIGMI